MKSIRILSLGRALILALGAFGVSSTPANAQLARAEGNFTLLKAVQWRGMLLPAGNYTFVLESSQMPALLEVYQPDSKIKAIFASSWISEATTGESKLLLEGDGGDAFVSGLYLKELGLVLHYPSPLQTRKKVIHLAEETSPQSPPAGNR